MKFFKLINVKGIGKKYSDLLKLNHSYAGNYFTDSFIKINGIDDLFSSGRFQKIK